VLDFKIPLLRPITPQTGLVKAQREYANDSAEGLIVSDIRRVLVVGGGVGGLTAGATLARRGVEVVLIERRTAFAIPGIGLGQPANALRIYHTLGVLDEILATGFTYDRMHLFDPGRGLIVEHKFLLGDDRVPAFCALSRLQLHEILLGAAERAGVQIHLGVTVSEIHEDNDRVDVQFSTGQRDAFDLLAGFDGIRSTTRLHLVGTSFAPRPSGYGAWRVQAPRPNYVRGMEFLQGIGSKTGAIPLSNDIMYLFHIRPETAGADFAGQDRAHLFKARLAGYGSYVAEIAASLNSDSDIVYSPIEPLMLPWPWFRRRVVIGGDAAHIFAPHLTQGAAMAAEDAFVLAREVLDDDVPVEARLMRYSMKRYPRCAFVYTFSGQWLHDEQSVRSAQDLEAARAELTRNASARIGASDRILNDPV
jgi:2-polyprenyl-6-methoxyphenol hydroxylase-like FAD-dependent oxidoreductase